MTKIIGYSIEVDCGKYKNLYAFRVSYKDALKVAKEMKQYGYRKIKITRKYYGGKNDQKTN